MSSVIAACLSLLTHYLKNGYFSIAYRQTWIVDNFFRTSTFKVASWYIRKYSFCRLFGIDGVILYQFELAAPFHSISIMLSLYIKVRENFNLFLQNSNDLALIFGVKMECLFLPMSNSMSSIFQLKLCSERWTWIWNVVCSFPRTCYIRSIGW